MLTKLSSAVALAMLCGCSIRDQDRDAIVSAASGVGVVRHDDRVEVTLDGLPLTTFHFHSRWDKPFLHPLRTPSGLVISRGFPVEPTPEESKDHTWHRGIWFGHGDVNGEDFWREKPDGSTARLVMTGEPTVVSDGFEVRLNMISRAGTRMGTITERYSFARENQSLLIDSTIRIAADARQALRFGDSDDGGFGIRLADRFRQDKGATLTSSEGAAGTEAIWGKPAKWVDYTAAVDGARAGATLFDHPGNPRHPVRWHARPYALNAANPFALRSFTGNKADEGSWTLPAGQSQDFRWLVALHDGDLTAEMARRLFERFAAD